MDIMKFITENALQLVPVFYIIGYVIKQTTLIKDKFIPITLIGISLISTPYFLGSFTDPQSYVQAILVAGITVTADQVIKQSQKAE